MDAALFASMLALGVAGSSHCVAMCAAPCAALTGGGRSRWAWFHGARMISYGAAGGLAAASINAIEALGTTLPLMRPLWALVHAAALSLGLWLLVFGRQPAWLERIGRPPPVEQHPIRVHGQAAAAVRTGAAGLLWVAWPCGLLQSAILVAALADRAVVGAALMAMFAATTAIGMTAAPWAWRRLAAGRIATSPALGIRIAGSCLALASAWALGSGLWQRVAAYCGF